MRARSTLFVLLAGGIATSAVACSCFGPQTFCGVLDPPFPNPEWWIPESVVLGVKLDDVQYGMDIKVIQSFSGSLQVNDTVRVWGDCGLLCRHYATTWNVGDTVVWALMPTDLAGNSLCGTSYEQPGDHMISICGVYYLDYSAGMVSGPITTETPGSMSLEQFAQMVNDCSVTEVPGLEDPDLFTLSYVEGVPWIERRGAAAGMRLDILDGRGSVVVDRPWRGEPIALAGMTPGLYVVRVRTLGSSASLRVCVP